MLIIRFGTVLLAAITVSTGAWAQAFGNYAPATPQTNTETGVSGPYFGAGTPVIPTSDFIVAGRVVTAVPEPSGSLTAVPGGKLFAFGILPLSAFASSSDVAAAQAASSQAIATTNAQVATALGGGAGVDPNGLLTQPSYAVQGATYSNVGSAVGALDAGLSSNASRLNALSAGLASLTTGMAGVSSRIDGVQQFAVSARHEARQGVASAMAMANASMPSAVGRTSWVVNASTFQGESALGGSIAHRFNTSVPLAITAGVAYAGSYGGARVGLAGEF